MPVCQDARGDAVLLAEDCADPGAADHAQLLALVDGLDWTKVRPVVVKRPQSVG
jgi:hypothetical protein